MNKHLRMLAAAAALACGAVHAQAIITLTPPAQSLPWGIAPTLTAQAACAFSGTTLLLEEVGRGVVASTPLGPATCPPVVPPPTASITFNTSPLAYGPLSTRAYTARTDVMPSSAPVTVASIPELYLSFTGDTILFASGKSPGSSRCGRSQGQQLDRESSYFPPVPPNIRTPFEITSVTLSDCLTGTMTWPGPIPPASGTPVHLLPAVIKLPSDIPPLGELYVRDARSGYNWSPVARCPGPATCPVGSLATNRQANDMWFELTAESGSNLLAQMAVAFPQPDSRDFPLQDLWWSGDHESGWGLNIAKVGQKLFATLFIYRADGTPFWAVLPSGQWDPVHNVYYGDLYIPNGSSYAAYDTKKFDVGSPVGSLSLSFGNETGGHVDYVIGGQQGGKQLYRYEFGPKGPEVPSPVYGGMWWAGASQDGWGLSVQQQGDALFATWYTYDTQGRATWFFMPAGRKTADGKYAGTLYRTTGAEWVGRKNYDGRKTQVFPVGTMELAFTDANKGTMRSVVNGTTITQAISRFEF